MSPLHFGHLPLHILFFLLLSPFQLIPFIIRNRDQNFKLAAFLQESIAKTCTCIDRSYSIS